MGRKTIFHSTAAGRHRVRISQLCGAAAVLLASLGQSPLARADDQLLQLDADALDGELLSQQNATAGLALNMDVQVNDSEQRALLQNNKISNSVTGNNAISDNAFAGASGISTVIQNTGNQVVIQGSTMVNVLIHQ